MRLRIKLDAAEALLVVCTNILAQNSTEDAQNCKDSKLLSRLPGCFIKVCDNKEFDQQAVRTGPRKKENDAVKSLEGVVENIEYECPGRLSPLQVVQNAATALQRAGYQSVFNGKDENEALALTMRKADQWIQLSSSSGGDNDSTTFYTFRSVAVSAMKQEMEATAEAMTSELQTSGRMALYGINFATNSAGINPESDKVLSEIASLLKNQPTWNITVEGHTDNVGAKPANQALSQKRAEAVAAWLATHGVARPRLVAAGFGDTRPLQDNSIDEGRLKNRRVELVKR